jgi:hypothetical protein
MYKLNVREREADLDALRAMQANRPLKPPSRRARDAGEAQPSNAAKRDAATAARRAPRVELSDY